jgi:hypothetical protein
VLSRTGITSIKILSLSSPTGETMPARVGVLNLNMTCSLSR